MPSGVFPASTFLEHKVAPVDDPTHYRYPVSDLLNQLTLPNARVDVMGLKGTIGAQVATGLLGSTQRAGLIVVPDEADAEQWATDLQFFLGASTKVLQLPRFESTTLSHLGSERRTVMKLHGILSAVIWSETPIVLVTTAVALQRKVMPRSAFDEATQLLNPEMEIDRDAFAQSLIDAGYLAVPAVEDPGTFALRGSVLDLFPGGAPSPYRIELWGDEIDSIRPFSASSQRCTSESVDILVVPPVREESFGIASRQRAKSKMLSAAGEAGIPTRTLQPLLEDLNRGIPFVGIESVRAFFYECLDSVFDYLPTDTLVFWVDPLGCRALWTEVYQQAELAYERSVANQELVAPPQSGRFDALTLSSTIDSYGHAKFHTLNMETSDTDALCFQTPELSVLLTGFQSARNQREPLRPLVDYLRDCQRVSKAVMIVCSQRLQRERLERVFKSFGLPYVMVTGYAPVDTSLPWSVQLVEGEVSGSVSLLDPETVILSEFDIFGAKIRRRQRKSAEESSPFIQDFRELKPSDYVVHADHGIGQYMGLKKLAVGGHESDFLVVAFAGQDKLYLPIYKLGRLQKYSGSGQSPKVTKLGGTSWEKVKQRAKAAAEEDALALLDLYARREMASGYAFSPPDDYFRAFEGSFPFEETHDQARSIDEVLKDMGRERPMDRLLCGDVGFGKTEVALRGAFRAVLDGKQVCLLVPTTVLSLQHFKTFRARFADHPVEIALFSRLVKPAELKAQLDA